MISAGWGAIAKATLSPILRSLPGGILRWWYPVRKCQERLTVEAHGVGPHIYVNAERAPAISGLTLSLMNRLPFALEIESLHFEVSLESRGLTNHDHFVKESVPGSEVRQTVISDIHLSDGQAEIIRKYPSDCPTLRIAGHVQFVAPVGGGKKGFDVRTRAFIYRGDNYR